MLQKITKRVGFEPPNLKQWKRRNPQGTYKSLAAEVRIGIRTECLKEQFYLCAYCCQSISGLNNDCMNEHVDAQQISPQRTLDFTNIVASCTARKQCDHAHKSQPLPLTPLMGECETELEFKLSGRVIGKSERAAEAIKVLNLGDTEQNNRGLIEKRKQLVDILLFKNGVDPDEGLDDNELIEMVLEDISTPENGKLEAFSPVLINILRQWVA